MGIYMKYSDRHPLAFSIWLSFLILIVFLAATPYLCYLSNNAYSLMVYASWALVALCAGMAFKRLAEKKREHQLLYRLHVVISVAMFAFAAIPCVLILIGYRC